MSSGSDPFYRGDRYLDADETLALCQSLSRCFPRWVSYSEVAQTRGGRPLFVLTIGDHDAEPTQRPAFWMDGGTHAVEWTGVASCIFAVSRWVEALSSDDTATENAATKDWFQNHTVYCMPLISPDGVQAMFDGVPFLRSSLRPPPEGTVRSGLNPHDVDGDGAIRWMRWRHPAGPFVPDEDVPIAMRPRRLDDDPNNAWFLSMEGEFINWDGVRWTNAPREFGLDLNRNFPDAWRPFSMFGMDSGLYALSEAESRAVVDAFTARPFIGCALTNHTYTGALLTAPSRPDDPMSDSDVRQMELLAEEAVETTDYRVIRKHPTFQYDAKNPVVGCWDDAMCNTFGVAGFTLELWDPFRYCGVDNPDPAGFFKKPEWSKLKTMLGKFSEDPGAVEPWRAFDHPQLGPVEIGGIDYLRTVRNPPVSLLEAECERGFKVADTLRRSLPEIHVATELNVLADGVVHVRLILENRGYLCTSSLARGAQSGAALPVSARLESDGPALRSGAAGQAGPHLDGWGNSRVGDAANPIYPALPNSGHRAVFEWIVEGTGSLTIYWQGGRAGRGVESLTI